MNTPENEWCPGISPDGLTLIVNSTRPGGLGGEDLWLTTRATRSSPWGPLIHLDERINTPGEDAKPEFAADGSTLLFMSTRPGGHGFFDIWQVSLLKARREGGGRYMSPFSEHASRRGGWSSMSQQPCPRGRLSTSLLTTKVTTLPTKSAAPCTKRCPRPGNQLRQAGFDQRRQFWTNCASSGDAAGSNHS